MPEHKRPGAGRPRGNHSDGKPKPKHRGEMRSKGERPRPPPAAPQAPPSPPAPPPAPHPVQPETPNFEPPEYVVIAQIASPFGLRGAVKANIQTDFPERFEQLEAVYMAPPGPVAGAQWQRYNLV